MEDEWNYMSCTNLRLHSGSSPDQLPYTRQVRSLLPRYCLKPLLQVIVMVFPASVPAPFTVPSSGTRGTPHPRQKVDTWAWKNTGIWYVYQFICTIPISTHIRKKNHSGELSTGTKMNCYWNFECWSIFTLTRVNFNISAQSFSAVFFLI